MEPGRGEPRAPPKKQLTLGVDPPWWPTEDTIDDEVRADLDSMNLDTVGNDGPRLFAVTADEARKALDHFVSYRLQDFGKYEDAVMTEDWTMAHSLLSVPLNLGLLQPLDVAEAAEKPGATVMPHLRRSRGSSGRYRVARIRLASVLALRTGLREPERAGSPCATAEVVHRPRRRRADRGMSVAHLDRVT